MRDIMEEYGELILGGMAMCLFMGAVGMELLAGDGLFTRLIGFIAALYL